MGQGASRRTGVGRGEKSSLFEHPAGVFSSCPRHAGPQVLLYRNSFPAACDRAEWDNPPAQNITDRPLHTGQCKNSCEN